MCIGAHLPDAVKRDRILIILKAFCLQIFFTIYIYIYIYMNTHIQMHTYICVCACVYVYVYERTYKTAGT